MESLLKRTWAEVDLDHLAENLSAIRRHIGAGVKVLAVVKADAYGHGALYVARHLEMAGADCLAVSNVDEACELRAGGVGLPILVLGCSPADQMPRLLANNITQTVQDIQTACVYNDAARTCGGRLRVHIKLDTGMGRLGFQCDELNFEKSFDEICKVLSLDSLYAEGIFTHFCSADEETEEDAAYTEMQHARAVRMIDALAEKGFRFPLRHCCNSGAAALYPQYAWDMVRCGIALYGAGDMARVIGTKPVMRLKSVISTVKTLGEGESISYVRQFTTVRERRIGVLPIGYADGLFRVLGNRFSVLTAAGPAPICGRICMDMCMIDLTGLPDIGQGDEVEIYGEGNLVGDVAALAGTIPYELLCAVSKRVPRLYCEGGAVVAYDLRILR
ncbi:MAG: alanine racemase, partial [Oscillospiraceae bacterium]|nr:alanine racemase [Oscillospiraceae bacterium]